MLLTRKKKAPGGGDEDLDFDALLGLDDEEEQPLPAARSQRRVTSQPLWRRVLGVVWKSNQADSKPSASRKGDGEGSVGMRWTGQPQWVSRATTAGLWFLILCGVLGLVLALTRPSGVTREVASSGMDQRLMNRRDAATDTAQQFVSSWLTASNDNHDALDSWWDTSQMSFPDKAATVSDPRVSHTDPSRPGVWQVTVSVGVQQPGEKTSQRRYFMVPVAVSGDSRVAARPLALPGEVGAPSRNVPSVNLSYPQQVSSTGLQSSVQGFLNALLTGTGPITLYERPGVSIPAVTPAPYTVARLQSLAADYASSPSVLSDAAPKNGATAHVLATVQVGTGAGSNSTDSSSDQSDQDKDNNSALSLSQYELTLVARSGRWEVTTATAAPSMADSTARSATSSNTN